MSSREGGGWGVILFYALEGGWNYFACVKGGVRCFF